MDEGRSPVTSVVVTAVIVVLTIGLAVLLVLSRLPQKALAWVAPYFPSPSVSADQPAGHDILNYADSSDSHPEANWMAAPPDRPLLDVDQMAARFTDRHDIYVQIRDQALAAYASGHPTPAPYDERVRNILREIAYHETWGDPYGEGLWIDCQDNAVLARRQGAQDPMIDYMVNFDWYDGKTFDYRIRSLALGFSVGRIAQAGYPAIMVNEGARCALYLLYSYRIAYKLDDSDRSTTAAIGSALQFWRQGYQGMIAQHYPDSFLYRWADNLQESAKARQGDLDLAIFEQDRVFNETNQNPGLRMAVDGDYMVNSAWNARGSGWASSVSADGWRVFNDRLSDARSLLESAYQKYPNEEPVSRLMLRVTLGQQSDRAEMEQWFQRAIAADPHSYGAYRARNGSCSRAGTARWTICSPSGRTA